MNDSASVNVAPAPPRAERVRDDVWVIVPAFKEGLVIRRVVASLRASFAHVVVIDDGSPDETGAEAGRGGAVVLRHPINRGQGAALQTGIDYAIGCGASFVVTFDSDGQHRPEDIVALLRPLREGAADVALGSRFLTNASLIPARRRLLLKIAVQFTRLTTGLRVTDTHNGLRAFTREAAQSMNLRLDRMAHASEILDRIRQEALRYVEVPVTIDYHDYSLEKGQRNSAAIRILFDILIDKLLR